MYCSKCGSLVNNKLNYCNSCGAKLAKPDDEAGDSPKSMLDNVLTTAFLVAIFGLGILVGLVAVLLKNGVDHKAVMMISISYLAAVFGICYMLLSQLPKLIDARLNRQIYDSDVAPPVRLPAPNTAQLEEPKQSPISVTDNTTKTLDEVLLKRS